MTDCCAPAYGKVFGARGARRAVERYRRRGLDGTSRTIRDWVAARGVEGSAVTEIGGGVGALQIELLTAGASRSVNVDLSSEWEDAARGLLRDRGLEARADRRVGDAVASPSLVEPADFVVLNRVVCCYPDPDALVAVAAEAASRGVILSMPREHVAARAFVALVNVCLRLCRIEFRTYVHTRATIQAAAELHGFRRTFERTNAVWRVLGFERAARST